MAALSSRSVCRENLCSYCGKKARCKDRSAATIFCCGYRKIRGA